MLDEFGTVKTLVAGGIDAGVALRAVENLAAAMPASKPEITRDDLLAMNPAQVIRHYARGDLAHMMTEEPT